MSERSQADTMRVIEGLLAKAADAAATEAEAASSLAMANKLMLQYAIEEDELHQGKTTKQQYVSITLWRAKKQPQFDNFFKSIIHTHFNVRPILQIMRGQYSELVIFGTPEACDWAKHVYQFLRAKFEQLWLHHKRYDPAVEESYRSSYYYGLHQGLDDKLKEAKKEVEQAKSSNQNALIVIGKNLDNAFNEEFSGKFQQKSRIMIRSDEEVEAGKRDGRKIEILRSLPGGSNAPRLGVSR